MVIQKIYGLAYTTKMLKYFLSAVFSVFNIASKLKEYIYVCGVYIHPVCVADFTSRRM